MKLYYLAILLVATSAFSQGNHFTFDMTTEAYRIFTEKGEGFSFGNSISDPYIEFVHEGDLDFNHQDVEILNSKVIIYGDTINSGNVVLKHFGISQLVVMGKPLTVEEPKLTTYKMFPNPAVNRVRVSGEVDRLFMYDMYGRLITTSTNNTLNFDTPSPIYSVYQNK